VNEVRAGIDDLEGADEIFLTSAGIGIRPAFIGTSKAGSFPITNSIIRAFEQKTMIRR
jgi:branched-subunit amino acid aminotransferase/4-amino-4-deoxychorismate lyase